MLETASPKKLFGKKKIESQDISTHSLGSNPILITETLDIFNQSLNAEIVKQDQQITEILKKTSDNIINFTGPKVLDWNKNTGRIALAESVIKNSETEFLAFRQRMTAMADADGCGGKNEMAKSSESTLSSNANVIDFGQAKLNKALGVSNEHAHKSDEHDHCSHGNDYGECPSGCKKAA